MHLEAERYRKNYWLLVLEGMFFMGATGFFNTNTVIPVFVNMMTDSKQLVGLAITLASFFMYFCRLLIGPFMPHVRNHARFSTVLMFSLRPLLLFPAFFIFTGLDRASVIILIVAYVALWACDGLVVPAWSEVLSNTIDENRHGRLLGWQMLLGGFAGIGAGVLINVFLANPHMNIKNAYGWIFLIGGVFATLSCVMMMFVKNAPAPYKTGKVNFLGYFADLPKYLKLEMDFTKMMVIQFLFLSASMCIPFIILYCTDTLKTPQNTVASLILVQSVGVPLGGWLWGFICDRIGSHNGLKLAGFNILLPALISLLALVFKGIAPMIFMFPVILLAGITAGIWTCYYVYTIQAVRPESRSACLVLSSVITLPTAFTGYLAGYIAEQYGFVALFVICIALASAGMVLSLKLRSVQEIKNERTQSDG